MYLPSNIRPSGKPAQSVGFRLLSSLGLRPCFAGHIALGLCFRFRGLGFRLGRSFGLSRCYQHQMGELL